ncbi:hypothetical protein GCM10023200_15850 [Actinomycetospora chlora]|uniref:CBS domain-containing protein n=1 Tax=Actinomycetospora chlora TaxID=663608 RepID=A0ABP9AMG0_9PSEU
MTPTAPPPRLAAPPEALDDDPPVRVVMSPLGPVEVPSAMRVATALEQLRRLDGGHLVTRRHGQVRAVAEVDLLRHVLEAGARPARLLDPVGDLARPVSLVGPDLRRSAAAELMLAREDAVLVVAVDGEPCGLLDARTVLHSVARERR